MGKSYRDHSKTNYATRDGQTTISTEEINAGSLQRIADAMEVMAKDRVQLERDLKWYKEQYASRGAIIKGLENQIKGLKSIKSRFKNQLANQKKNDESTFS